MNVRIALTACWLVQLASCGTRVADPGGAGARRDAPEEPQGSCMKSPARGERATHGGAECHQQTISFGACVRDDAIRGPVQDLCRSHEMMVHAIAHRHRCDGSRSREAVVTCCPAVRAVSPSDAGSSPLSSDSIDAGTVPAWMKHCLPQTLEVHECADSATVMELAFAQCTSQGRGMMSFRPANRTVCASAHFLCCSLYPDGGLVGFGE